jgi:hypothetical protein
MLELLIQEEKNKKEVYKMPKQKDDTDIEDEDEKDEEDIEEDDY